MRRTRDTIQDRAILLPSQRWHLRTRIMALFSRASSQPYPLGYHKKPPQCLGSLACPMVVVSLIPYQTVSAFGGVGVSTISHLPPPKRETPLKKVALASAVRAFGSCFVRTTRNRSLSQFRNDKSRSSHRDHWGEESSVVKNSSADESLTRRYETETVDFPHPP